MKVKLKEKAIEMKEWVKEHRKDIAKVCFGVAAASFGATAGIFYGHIAGQEEGFIDGVGVGSRAVFKMFGDDVKELTRIRDNDTGMTKALMARAFYDTMLANSDVVRYDDGSWDFRSEAK